MIETVYENCNCCGSSPEVTVPCCENPVPETLYVTFSNGVGNYACLDGATREIIYNHTATGFPPFNRWQDSGPDFADCCGAEQDLGGLNFFCDEFGSTTGTPGFILEINGCASFQDNTDSLTCDPFYATGTAVSGGNTVDWVVTE